MAEFSEEVGAKFVKQAPPINRLVGEYPVSHADDTRPFLLRASIVLYTGEMLLLDRANKHIKLLDTNFKCLSVMKFTTYPFDICASNRKRNEFYVTEPEAQTVFCIMAGNGRMTKYKSWRIDEDCRGITCWKSGIALSVMRDGFRGTLGFLSYECKIKRKVWESELHAELFKAPWYLASIRDGDQVVVSDQGNHSVICVDAKTTNVIFIYKSDILIGPRTLTVDSEDNIYVIGSSETCHNVVKITPAGKLKGVLLSRRDKLNYPSGISYSMKDRAVVLQRNHDKPTVSIFRI
ncbi:uncharacterized protein LOC132713876 [Ruditapes philippinarum]|uniref:uncharacterized protein LOC132713876 n=1 Tax=Ruditapes philippinarum TaxID=129788 RepID=UPI00295AE8A6|nr:uncharacterized protein LOC132713876 [Ruditapes philippinarum]